MDCQLIVFFCGDIMINHPQIVLVPQSSFLKVSSVSLQRS